MSLLPNTQFHKLVNDIRTKDIYPDQPQRAIDWQAYTHNEINNIIQTLDFIKQEVDKISLPVKRKTGRPLTNPHSLAKAILLCEELGIDERNAQGWINILGPRIGINEQLDDRVIGDASTKEEVLYILKKVFENNKDSDGRLNGDGTHVEHTRKQNHETGCTKNTTPLTSIVDSREIVQAFDTEQHEREAIRQLLSQVDGESLRLDAGFVDRELTKNIVALGMTPFIFPKRNTNLKGHPSWKNMYFALLKDTIQWLIEYHQRSHCESFHSSFKRIFGIVTKRRPASKLAQITARIILHNRRRLAYFRMMD